MKLYAQFFNKPMAAYPQLNKATGRYEVMPNPDATPVEACGTDSVMVLDARYNTMAHYAKVKRHAKQHGYIGFQFVKAERFTDAGQRSKLTLV